MRYLNKILTVVISPCHHYVVPFLPSVAKSADTISLGSGVTPLCFAEVQPGVILVDRVTCGGIKLLAPAVGSKLIQLDGLVDWLCCRG